MSKRKLSTGKLTSLAAAIAISAALIAAPALALGGGGWHGGGGAWHGAAIHGAAIRGAAIHGAAWHGAAWHGAAWHGGWHGRFFPHHRFAFFHHRRHFGPLFGLYASGYSSCWSWVPTAFGWRRVWVCGPYGYGYY